MISSHSTISSSEVNLWDSRDFFVKLQVVLPLLNIWGWLADWMGCCWTPASLVWMGCRSLTLYCVLLLVPLLVSGAVLWFALLPLAVLLSWHAVGLALLLPAVGLALLLPAVGFALLLPAVGLALLGAFHLPVLLYFVLLFTPHSLAVVLSRILTAGSLAVAPSVFLSHHWLLGQLLCL